MTFMRLPCINTSPQRLNPMSVYIKLKKRYKKDGLMEFDLTKASSRLSKLDLKITDGDLHLNILWFRAMQCNADYIIERHTHSTFEFHFVYEGSSRVMLDNGSFAAGAGDLYITAPGVYHRQEILKGYIEFSMNCELSTAEHPAPEAQYIVNILKNAECRPVRDTAGAIGLFFKALEEAYYQDTGYYSNIRLFAVMLVTAAARAIGGSAPVGYAVPLKQKKNEFRFFQIQKYISDNISLPIKTSDIAKYLFLGEKQIARIVRDAAGMTTKELVQELKFRKAKELLLQRQELSIRDISDLLGFSSEYYFNQFFKRKEGYPPGVFRSNVRNH
jgi:AraC-like DNA-binding protein/mannose-6-phosphate isomerase-like protein (cupin superfamily)